MAYFDNYGWYTTEVLVDRVAVIEPANTSITEVDGELRSNWTGNEWVNIPYKKFEYVETIPVPQSITKVQAMRAMKQIDVDAVAGTSMWTNFQSLLASNADANDEWVLALDLQRNNQFVRTLTPALGKTDAQIDDLFVLAGTL